MLHAAVLSDCSWILQDDKGNKMGIISYNANKEKYLLITEDIDIELGSMQELSEGLGQPVHFKERQAITEVHKDLFGYPTCHDIATDVEQLKNGIVQYMPGGKSKKLFYAGYWVVTDKSNNWVYRLSLSKEMYNQSTSDGKIHGPYKDRMQANFMVKQENSSK